MQNQANQNDTQPRDPETDMELAGVLSAISVVSKRLARKLMLLSVQEEMVKGEKTDGQNQCNEPISV